MKRKKEFPIQYLGAFNEASMEIQLGPILGLFWMVLFFPFVQGVDWAIDSVCTRLAAAPRVRIILVRDFGSRVPRESERGKKEEETETARECVGVAAFHTVVSLQMLMRMLRLPTAEDTPSEITQRFFFFFFFFFLPSFLHSFYFILFFFFSPPCLFAFSQTDEWYRKKTSLLLLFINNVAERSSTSLRGTTTVTTVTTVTTRPVPKGYFKPFKSGRLLVSTLSLLFCHLFERCLLSLSCRVQERTRMKARESLPQCR